MHDANFTNMRLKKYSLTYTITYVNCNHVSMDHSNCYYAYVYEKR